MVRRGAAVPSQPARGRPASPVKNSCFVEEKEDVGARFGVDWCWVVGGKWRVAVVGTGDGVWLCKRPRSVVWTCQRSRVGHPVHSIPKNHTPRPRVSLQPMCTLQSISFSRAALQSNARKKTTRNQKTTLNSGSLGSCVDEERSKARKVV